MTYDIYTSSPEETENFGKQIAAELAGDASLPRFIALYGDLGVGKTAFVRGLASVLSPGAAVRSPTFALVNEYRRGAIPVFHFDMYRIEDEDALESIGFYDYLDRGLCVVEWSENIPYALPECHLRVEITKCDADKPNLRHIGAKLVKNY